MTFFVYMLKCITPNIKKSYVGYSKNVELRLKNTTLEKGLNQHEDIYGLLFIRKI